MQRERPCPSSWKRSGRRLIPDPSGPIPDIPITVLPVGMLPPTVSLVSRPREILPRETPLAEQ
ncbi:MAG: hypothetical protein WBS24_12515 [Terriglobales bacterium]